MLSQRKRLLILAVPVAASLALAGPASAAGSDKAILKGGVITKADVPADWTSKRSNASSDALRGLKECKKINTAVAAAKKDAGKFVSAYKGSAATACFTRLGTEVERNRPAATPPTVSPITDLQGVGDEAVGYEIAATFTQNGGEATLYIDFIIVRVGRAVLGFAFTNVGARITQGPDIVNAVVQRVAAAEM